jgi:glutamate-ammonia-ligase adenylyltransferase
MAFRIQPEVMAEIQRLAADSPDPRGLLSSFERLGNALPGTPSKELLSLLARLFELSDFLPRMLSARPALVRRLARVAAWKREKPLEQYLRESALAMRGISGADEAAFYRRLRLYKYRELARLMARDLMLTADAEELGRELSHLAQAIVSVALERVRRAMVARYGMPHEDGFCVLGLGKLGGEDLNFSSDIDLLYVYQADGQTQGGSSGSLSNAQFYTKLSEGLTRALSAITAEGFCFRVDLNLRPQGRSGAIALSLPATLGYYEAQGRTWERAALLKARVIAGDEELANRLIQSLTPFVWRRSLDLSVVEALRKLKAQIDARAQASAEDVKLGPGGIREIEFFVNALQLLHGGQKPAVRERNTLRALRKLDREGLVASADAEALEEAYLFLRRVENHLQMMEERQTHRLPAGNVENLRLARSLGFADWTSFAARLSEHREFVRLAFSQLLGQSVRDETPDEPLLLLAMDPEAPDDRRREALEQRGFAASDRALEALGRLSRAPGSLFGFSPGGPEPQAIKLLAEIAKTPDPDQALFFFCDFLTGLRSPAGYLSILVEAPEVRRRMLNLFAQSDYLSQYFLRHPELLDVLVQRDFGPTDPSGSRVREELAIRLQRSSDLEERLTAMRRFKNEGLLRIGLNDISGEISVPDVADQLTTVADAILDEVLQLAQKEQLERYGEPRSGSKVETLAVIALGKLGGRELGYHSDLDLLFVYSGSGTDETSGGSRGRISHHEYFAKLVQRLLYFMQLHLREGHLYKVDTRLRPSGNQGTLVVRQETFRDHHQRRGQIWERQSLIKARPLAGDLAMAGQLLANLIHPLVYERPLPADAAAEIDRLRRRMEVEISKETAEDLDPKGGYGGLVDIEFAVQYLQLVFGGRFSSVRTSNTLKALSGLQAEACIDPKDAEVLREGYIFHRRLENRLRLVQGRSIARLPTSGRPLVLLARRLGYRGPSAATSFLTDYQRHSVNVRLAYQRSLRREAQ